MKPFLRSAFVLGPELRRCAAVSHRRALIVALLGTAALLGPWSSARAHTNVTCPVSRDGRDDHKDSNGGAPCGVARMSSQAVGHFAPGSSIAVQWKETVNHPGCFLVDFSAAGDANFQMLANVKHSTSGSTPRSYSTMVTLPTAPCDSCTLRVRQVMLANDTTACPPATIPMDVTYYSCSNVVIADGASDTCGMGSGTGGAGGKNGAGGKPGTAGTNGNGGKGAGGQTSNGGSSASSGGAPGSGGATSSGGSSSSGGATSSGGSSSSGGATSSGGSSSSGGSTASGGASSSGGSNGSGGSAASGSGGSSSSGSGGSKGATGDDAGGCAYVGGTTSLMALAASIGGLVMALRRRTRRASSAPRPSI